MSAIQKYSDIAKNLEFCEDFGEGPLLLGHFTQDRSLIGVISLLGGFIAMAALGIPGALLVAFAAFNDLSYTGKDGKPIEASNGTRTEPTTIAQPDIQPTEIILDVESIEVQTTHIPNVESVVMPEPIAAIPEATRPSYGESRVTSPMDKLLASPFQSRAFFGAQRTGKSYLAAVTSQQMHLLRTKVFHVNLHSFGSEDLTYWTHARSVTGDMGHMDEYEVLDLIARAIAVVKEFTRTPNALLIFDEVTLTGSKNNPYAEFLQPLLKMVASSCSELASTGKKRKQAIWTISPDFVAGELVQEVKAIKSLAITFVAIPPGKTLDWEGQAIGFHSESFGNVQRNFPALKDAPRMDVDRMVFIDAIWYDLGILPKLIHIDAKPEPIETSTKSILVETIKAVEIEHWEADRAIEVNKVEPTKPHLLSDKFERLDTLMDGKDSLPIREIQRAFGCLSEEAQQIAQMYCFNKKSIYRFSQFTNSNGTLSKSIERL